MGVVVQKVELSVVVLHVGFEVEVVNHFVECFEKLVIVAFAADSESDAIDDVAQLAHFVSIDVRFNDALVDLFGNLS